MKWFGERKKRQRADAVLLLSEVPKGPFGLLLMVFSAFKLQNADEANRRLAGYPSEADALLGVLERPRHPRLSAGIGGDRLNLNVWRTELIGQGYSEQAATIIAFVYQHSLEPLLEEADSRSALGIVT